MSLYLSPDLLHRLFFADDDWHGSPQDCPALCYPCIGRVSSLRRKVQRLGSVIFTRKMSSPGQWSKNFTLMRNLYKSVVAWTWHPVFSRGISIPPSSTITVLFLTANATNSVIIKTKQKAFRKISSLLFRLYAKREGNYISVCLAPNAVKECRIAQEMCH